ncbi:MAG TPA: RHS repeat-associated core domain-containing protein [Terriglobales bacterium]|nr:RHS repeat-associated core domain-containing protein [Terriglobales bacterium]
MTAGTTGQGAVSTPTTGSLLVTPSNPASLVTGQTQTFTAQAIDVTGAPAQNVLVNLIVSGANQTELYATTDASGQAVFQYSGTRAGTDGIQASADISGMAAYSSVVNMTWTDPSGPGAPQYASQGWIATPYQNSIVQGQVPVTIQCGCHVVSGTLSYWPTSNPGAVTVINPNTTGYNGDTVGILDTTTLANGSYTIQLVATAPNYGYSSNEVSQVTVNVAGDSKPGRMKSTITEFKVPLAGIPISISRTYDSLERSIVEDFGYGWKLGIYVDLQVDPQNNVTFNFDGRRITFFFTPQPVSFFGAWLYPSYTPQPGVHGSLASDGCGGLLQIQNNVVCFPDTGQKYQPTVYAYTDPVGRTYTISAGGQLQSIKDLNGNTLTVTPNGITSSAGNVVIPFVRDGSGRIIQISDLSSPPNNYIYGYDGSGNLQSVQHPGLSAPETYTYFPDHSLQTEIDPRGNSSSATYYPDGRLQSVTGPTVPDANGNPVQYTTQYAYNLSTNTTTITNPDGGTVTRTDDSFGKPLSITDALNRTTTYAYDSKENVISMTDAMQPSATTKYTYDANGFQTSAQLPGLPADSKTYNQFGGITSQTDAAGTNTPTTTYDANFNPSQTTDLLNGPNSFVASYTYDGMGNVVTVADANQKTATFDYWPQGYLMDTFDALQERTHYTYDAMGKVSTVTDPRGKVTQYFYDALERLSKTIDANNVTTQFVYDDNGNKTDEIDALGTPLQRTTHTDYDNLNRASKITYADGTTKQFFYDFRGNKLTEIDQLQRTTKYVYDLAGQLTSVTSAYGTPDAGTVSYTYDADGRQKTVTDELGNVTTNFYDPAGRLTSVQDAAQNSTGYGYDSDGRRASVTDANHNTTTYKYDARGRMYLITYPTSPATTTTTQYTFDGMGRTLITTDQDGKITSKTYDDVGRMKTVTDAMLPVGNTTTYGYDLAGNLASILDANQHSTTFQYDNLNRRSKKTLPLQQFETYDYDALGRLWHKTDFTLKTTTYTYDSLDRLLSKTPDSSLNQPAITFTYTLTGQRAKMTDASGATNYPTYDNRDRLKTKITPEGTLNYTYDAHGNVLTIASSNASGAAMTYTYDVLNRLATATDNRLAAQGGPANPTTYSYDPVGNLSGYVYPNAVQTGNSFDALNRLTQTCEAMTAPACSAGAKLASYAYTLGNAGNRRSVLELGGRNVAYGYDNDYRLASEGTTGDPAGNNGTVNYTQYDAAGNRMLMSSTLNAVPGGSFSYDANDRLATDLYDNNGNTTFSAGILNTYDFENRMLTHGAVSMVYDGDGNRVSETIGGTTTKFLVDDKNPTGLPQVLDEIVSGSVTRTYAYGRQRISENQLVGSTWTPTFYGYDGHGNARFLTNTAGAITDSYTFDAFGMPITMTGTTPNNFLYSGEQFDSSTGLYYLRARYFNAATGRFMTMDPWHQKSCCGSCSPSRSNPYAYADDDPVNRIDPTGRDGVETATLYRFVLVYTAATVLYYALTERCAEAKAACIVLCTADVLEVPYGPTDRSGDFFRCMHRCMEAAGCE